MFIYKIIAVRKDGSVLKECRQTFLQAVDVYLEKARDAAYTSSEIIRLQICNGQIIAREQRFSYSK